MTDIVELLGDEAESLLNYEVTGIRRDALTLPGPDTVERTFVTSDRSPHPHRNRA